MFKKIIAGILAAGFAVSAVQADERELTAEQEKALEIYSTIIAFKSTKQHGETPAMAAYIADELVGAGFPRDDIEIVPIENTAALIARYRSDDSSGKAPVLFLAHMDVVEADPKDWIYPPFELREEDGWYIGRGTADNKYGVMNLTQSFMRLKQEGFTPDRDLILVFTGDEETDMATTKYLAYERPDLQEAEFVLNSDAGGGAVTKDGTLLPYFLQAAEKTYSTFHITATNPGGHSSAPRPDNAIYDLADAVLKVKEYQFPVMHNDITLGALKADGLLTGGEIGEAMVRFAENPKDKKAMKTLRANHDYGHVLSTTCVATMLDAGHAENALPQSAQATVNCRIFPGVEVEEVRQKLADVIGNDTLTVTPVEDDYVASPVSPMRDDVKAALQAALDERHPDLEIVPYMSSGGTDGMHFRIAGVPTYGVSAGFSTIGESENAHGLNERVNADFFHEGLDHWIHLIKALAGAEDATAE